MTGDDEGVAVALTAPAPAAMAMMGAVQTAAAIRRILVVFARMMSSPFGGSRKRCRAFTADARTHQILRAGLVRGDPPAGGAHPRRGDSLAGLRDLTI